MNVLAKIIRLIESKDARYELIEHPPARTSQEATDITGWPLGCAAKSIIFKCQEQFVLCVVRGDHRLDYRKLRKLMDTRKIRLASPQEVQQVTGVAIGACYPFPSVAAIQGYADETLASCPTISFSAGTHTHHVRMSWKDYLKVTRIELADLAQD